jgi:hypothetical protein
MARLFTTGFELGTTLSSSTANVDGNATGTTVPVAESTTVRSGARSTKCAGTSANTSAALFPYTGSLNHSFFFRCCFNFSTMPSAASTTIIKINTNTAANLVGIRVTSGGKLQLWREAATAAQIGSDSTTTLVAGQWYTIELAVKVVGSGSADYAEGRLDGVSFASTNAQTLGATAPGGNAQAGFLTAPGNTINAFLDDVAINDDTGVTSQNTFPGVGKVVALWPTSDSAIAGWTGGAGGTTNLWDALNNVPPTGVATASATNTSQIKDAVSSATDNYDANCTTYTAAGIGASDTIKVVQPFGAAGPGTAVSIARSIGVVSNPAISDVTGLATSSAVSTYPTAWNLWVGGLAVDPSVTLGTAPVLRCGKRTASTNVLHFCSAGIYVDYTPGVAQVIPDVIMAPLR